MICQRDDSPVVSDTPIATAWYDPAACPLLGYSRRVGDIDDAEGTSVDACAELSPTLAPQGWGTRPPGRHASD